MGDEKVKVFNKTLSEFQKQGETLTETIKIKRENIVKETNNVRLLEGYHRTHNYIQKMYEDVPEGQIVQMDDDKYSRFTAPLVSAVVSGEAVNFLHNESRGTWSIVDQHLNTTASLCLSGSSDSTSVDVLSLFEPVLFPNRDRLTNEFEIEDETEKHIDIITKELGVSFPDLKNDFDAFIRKFYAFQSDKSQYQDLIGVRSLFFLKMIFNFSERNYGVNNPIDRRGDIRRFIFGSTPPVVSDEPAIEKGYHLYIELSSQDSSGMSVKTGNVDVAYIEGLFKRLIGSIAAILQLRGRYFQP